MRKDSIPYILIGFASVLAGLALIMEFWAFENQVDITYYIVPLEILIYGIVGLGAYCGLKGTDNIMGLFANLSMVMGSLIIFLGLGILIVEPNFQIYISKELLLGNLVFGIATLALIWLYVWYKTPIRIKVKVVEVEPIE